MTPEREKYLASISEKERTIRSAIRMVEYRLKEAKEWWSRHEPKKIGGYKRVVKREKTILMACKCELARIKGMDRVVVPTVSYIGNDIYLQRVERCSCGERLMGEIYCPNCGKRILWEKVK